MLYFSVYLRFFLASLPSLFLQIGHYLLQPNSANLLPTRYESVGSDD